MSGSEIALKRINSWLQFVGQEAFVLHGAAGTGKTTIAAQIARDFDGTVLCATLTNKAVAVLRSKGLVGAQTIHSLIYRLADGRECKCNARSVLSNSGSFLVHESGCPSLHPVYVVNEDSPLCHADLLILDEVSMIGREDADILLSFGVPILALGDPFQLPPIGDDGGYFVNCEPDCFLDEIHRQAAESPVIQLATDVREGKELLLGKYGDSGVVGRGYDELDWEAQFIVGMHVTRVRYNRLVRRQLGFTGLLPDAGERLICKQTDHKSGLINGDMWTVVSRRNADSSYVDLVVAREGEDVGRLFRSWAYGFTGLSGFNTLKGMSYRDRKQKAEFWHGYAITCHSAQGSEWPSVVVRDEKDKFPRRGWDATKRSQWLYTAITRASERVTVVVD